MQMYKVFFKESCFLLCDDQNSLKNGTVSHIHKDFNETKTFIIRQLDKKEKFDAVILYDDLEALFSVFKSCFLYVKAAGGIVINDSHILMIKRLGIPDLPKGHLESGESIEQCAIREVEEECGIHDLTITGPLTDTLHIYSRDENWYLKKTYWYTMDCPSGQPLTPQTEEDIEEVYWLPMNEINNILDKTYPSLKTVLSELKMKKSVSKENF